ncbi:MAG: type IV pilus biogenesis protein PilP, partial [Sutterella sp.]|nr:type IV pilus biogenesis protein PilP [Sutterella sp.]
PQLSPSAGVPGLPEKKESTRIVVMAVRGTNENLSATLRTKDGSHVVKTGDTVPGFGKVQSITRDRVVINGSAIPWM